MFDKKKMMKRLYYTLFILGTISLQAQTVDVTFVVDMNTQPISANGVYIAGSFQDWTPSTTEMSDLDADGVYEVVVSLEQDSVYEYKFLNGNEWESVSGVCGTPENGNRTLNTGLDSVLVLSQACFASCDPCPLTDQTTTFKVDMSLTPVSANGVYLAGNFQGWDPSSTEMLDEDGDNIYEVTLTGIEAGDYEYKFINGNDWGNDEDLSGLDCANENQNRSVSVISATTEVGPFCYGECGSCIMPVNVVFRVDMSNETISSNGVHLAGDFQEWDPSATEMLDDENDGIFEVGLELNIGTYQYKFVNGNGWSGDNDNESLPVECNVENNRELTLSSDTVIEYCYNQCEAICNKYPSPAEITFAVDMNNVEAVDLSGVWIIGSFTSPQWQDGRVQMFEHQEYPGIYTTTLLVDGPEDIQYKFSNGEPILGTPFQDGESANLDSLGCGSANGIGGWNRNFVRSGEAEHAGVFCYNTCENCNNSTLNTIEQTAHISDFYFFPNPTQDVLNFSNKVNFHIVNLLGKRIQSGEGDFVDVSLLAPGLYYLEMPAKKETFIFVKQ